jgi:3-oxoacyl-[acyl-carrier-protein] synthase-3
MPDSAVAIGVAGIGMYVPPDVVTARQLANETGIPADILFQKFGIRQVHRAGPDCHVSQMALAAAEAALQDAQVEPDEIDLVVYCGSEFKDYVVWSAATKITHLLGADRAEAFEVYALCAGTPVTLRIVRSMMLTDPLLRTVLVVAASKESALVDRSNSRGRFMFNFGDGASAAVLRRGLDRNEVLASASIVDGSLSEDVVMRAGGSRHPANDDTVAAGDHYLDVPDLDHMRSRLDEVSGDNFRRVVSTALRDSGRDHVDFLAPVHMKRSMHDWLREAVHAKRSFYLEEYGHMQAADQFVALVEGRRLGLLRDGDTVVLAAAGVGYTWAASVLSWGAAT